MQALAEQNCTVCQVGDWPMTDAEIEKYLQEVPDWQTAEIDSVRQIQRTFTFKDYASTLAFTHAVGQAAETAGHHPSILTEWGKVTVAWWTHKIRGLHANDFIMAAKTDHLYLDR